MEKFTTAAAMAVFGFAALTAADATAARQRTFVASYGSDANLCIIAAPCRTFPPAVALTLNGGEVVVLDSGEFGSVTITQSIQSSGRARCTRESPSQAAPASSSTRRARRSGSKGSAWKHRRRGGCARRRCGARVDRALHDYGIFRRRDQGERRRSQDLRPRHHDSRQRRRDLHRWRDQDRGRPQPPRKELGCGNARRVRLPRHDSQLGDCAQRHPRRSDPADGGHRENCDRRHVNRGKRRGWGSRKRGRREHRHTVAVDERVATQCERASRRRRRRRDDRHGR